MTQRRYNPFHQAHLFQHMRNPVAGNIYYVEGTGGLDTNDGRTLETAFETITHALTVTESDNNDYIFVRRVDNAAETFPITVADSFVHLIGMPYGASPRPQILPPGDTHGVEVDAGGVEIAGFDFGAAEANLDACINIDANQWRIHIHHCNFAWQTEAYDCIRINGDNQSYIHHNMFGAHGFSNCGICITDAMRTRIEDNVFFVLNSLVGGGQYGIYVTSTLQYGVIKNNTFLVPDAMSGEAIFLTSYGRSIIDGNHAMSDTVAMGFNPYRDTTGAAQNRHGWGANYANAALTLPVTV